MKPDSTVNEYDVFVRTADGKLIDQFNYIPSASELPQDVWIKIDIKKRTTQPVSSSSSTEV
jgi:hypothetical protein